MRVSVLFLCTFLSGSSTQAENLDIVGRACDASGQLCESCMPTKIQFIPNGFSLIESTSNHVSKSFQSDLTASVDAGASVLMGLLSENAKIEFKKKAALQDLEHIENYSYRNKIGEYRVTEILPGSPCGSHFVKSVVLGASFSSFVKLRFKTEESYQRFTKQVTVSAFWGLIKKTMTSTDESGNQQSDIELEVNAFQSGGDPSKLQNILMSVEAEGCRLQSIDACFKLHSNLFKYVRDDLPSQLEIPSNPDHLDAFLRTLEVFNMKLEQYPSYLSNIHQ